MLTDASAAELPDWNVRKLAQWDRVKDRIPGLQLVRSGQGRSQFQINISTEDAFYEGLVYGQLEQVQIERVRHRVADFRDLPPDKKSIENTRIDLSDAEIDVALACWRHGQSVANLSFARLVYGANGKQVKVS